MSSSREDFNLILMNLMQISKGYWPEKFLVLRSARLNDNNNNQFLQKTTKINLFLVNTIIIK